MLLITRGNSYYGGKGVYVPHYHDLGRKQRRQLRNFLDKSRTCRQRGDYMPPCVIVEPGDLRWTTLDAVFKRETEVFDRLIRELCTDTESGRMLNEVVTKYMNETVDLAILLYEAEKRKEIKTECGKELVDRLAAAGVYVYRTVKKMFDELDQPERERQAAEAAAREVMEQQETRLFRERVKMALDDTAHYEVMAEFSS